MIRSCQSSSSLLDLIQEALDRGDTHFPGIEQAFELFAIVDESLGAHRSLSVEHHAVRQPADAIGDAEIARQDIGKTVELAARDEGFMLGRIAVARKND